MSPSKRKEMGISKYHISDGEMIEIVKKDLKEDIKNTCLNLEKLMKAMSGLKGESLDEEADKAALLTLYHIRNVIKD